MAKPILSVPTSRAKMAPLAFFQSSALAILEGCRSTFVALIVDVLFLCLLLECFFLVCVLEFYGRYLEGIATSDLTAAIMLDDGCLL